MDMKHLKIKAFGLLLLAILLVSAAGLRQQKHYLVLEEQKTGDIYKKVPVKTNDELSFTWEHSFEHIPWNEYYRVEKSGDFLLHTISVAGFGAGIPAEMDCTYRYEDGLIYMEDIESRFPRFSFINSHTALKQITLNGQLLITGTDMPHHKGFTLSIK